jgi:hypothetical protein
VRISKGEKLADVPLEDRNAPAVRNPVDFNVEAVANTLRLDHARA